MPSRKIAAALALTTLLSGCGLITHGTYQKIRFISDPPGAEVWVNDQKQTINGEDQTSSLPRHEAVVTFKKAGYIPEIITLKCKTSSYFYWSLVMGILAAGVDWIAGSWREFEQDTVSVTLKPEPGTRPQRTVVVTSSPPGAEVSIGTASLGRTKGQGETPLSVLLTWEADEKEESKTLTFTLYDHESKNMTLRRGDKAIFAKLDPKPEEIPVDFYSVPGDATVLIDGDRITGRTPTSATFKWVSDTKPKKVEFQKEGYQPLSLTLNRGNRTIRVELKEIITESLLKIETVPAGAYIEVDGSLSGPAPSEISLKWSVLTTQHKVRCILPGYQTSQAFTVEKATQSPVRISLKPMLPRLP
ncbi:MAG TPA: PEGA domain-containing protein [Planctomycetota bacterium]|jgi:hypothetical protein